MEHHIVWPRVQLRLLLCIRWCLCIIAVVLAGYTGTRFRVFLSGDDPVRQLMRAMVALVFTTVLAEIPALLVPLVYLAKGSLTPALMVRMSAALVFLWIAIMGLCAGILGSYVDLSAKHEEVVGLLAIIMLQVVTTLYMLVWSSNVRRRGYGEQVRRVQHPAVPEREARQLPATSARPTSLPTPKAAATLPYRYPAQAIELPAEREPVPAQEMRVTASPPLLELQNVYQPHQSHELATQSRTGHPSPPRPGSHGYITNQNTIVVNGVVYRAVTPGQPFRPVFELYGG